MQNSDKHIILLHPLNGNAQTMYPFALMGRLMGFNVHTPQSELSGRWYEILSTTPIIDDDGITFPEDVENIKKSFNKIETLLDDLINNHHVDPNKIYLVGLSQGGGIATYTGLKSKHRLGGVFGILSYVPLITVSEEESTFDKTRSVELINGTQDELIKPEYITYLSEKYPYVKVDWVDCGHEASTELIQPILKRIIGTRDLGSQLGKIFETMTK